MKRDQQVYNGSTFSGVLKDGMICGITMPFIHNFKNHTAYFYGFGSGGYDDQGYIDSSRVDSAHRITSG